MSDDETALQPFASNQICATVDEADGELLRKLRNISDADSVDIYPPSRGPEVLAPSGILDRIRMAVSEDARAIDDLVTAAEAGETIISIDGVDDDKTANQITDVLVDHGAGWVFRFDDLSWTELYSPASRDAADS